LKFLRQPDGSFQVVDLSSSNGLSFNGKLLEPGVQTPIAPGDEIVIGMWTRIVIRAR
jgi:predicted component of type VI protein secretion system